ncbi:MAG: hypothetical protein CVU62_13000 [Deltaproteobacteria bacterium HGW-Deltaproteobacteria-2]|jgi:hypothetical protein|nr:MAG: hypothetical protein CVU62_13000 [Deltaproteobacteria bacterium HGW-Deltaproteobacteria-2]
MQYFSSNKSRFILRILFLFTLLSTCISQNLYAEDNWKLIKNDDGIEVYVRPYKNSGLNECKGITTIPASMDIICRLLSDATLHKKFVHNSYESFVIKPWENGHLIHYIALKAPWPLRNRDIVYDTHGEINPEMNRMIFYCLAVKEPLVPYKDRTVRITNSEHTWTLEKISPDKTRVTYQNFTEPVAAYVPEWGVNLITKETPYYSLKNMRNIVLESIKDSSYKTLVCPELPIKTEVNNKNLP